jgi:hypothetical protein
MNSEQAEGRGYDAVFQCQELLDATGLVAVNVDLLVPKLSMLHVVRSDGQPVSEEEWRTYAEHIIESLRDTWRNQVAALKERKGPTQ